MILVDSSVWIDHFRHGNTRLQHLLLEDCIVTHEAVIEELSLGNLAKRDETLGYFMGLARLPRVTHEEFLITVRTRELWGRGLGAIDVHLLSATLITPGASLWTRDNRLHQAAMSLGVAIAQGQY